VLAIKTVKNGKHILSIETDTADLFFKNLFTVHCGAALGLAAHFLFESAHARKRLPENVFALLESDDVLRRLRSADPDMLEFSTDPSDARREFERFRLGPTGRLSEEQIRAADALRIYGGTLRRTPLSEWIAPETGAR
jgi:hypothetical protein